MIGSELARYPEYLLGRAREELSVEARPRGVQLRLASTFVRIFGVPEIGVRLRIAHVLRRLPHDVGALADLGCGAGMLLGAVVRRKRFRRLAGFEIDVESARIASRVHRDAEIFELPVEAAPAEFERAFDTAVCIDVLEHLDDATLHRFVARAFEMLRPGGTLVVHVPSVVQRRHFARFRTWGHADHVREGFSPSELAALLGAAGFELRALEATFGSAASFAWETNMLVAASPLQALVFPLALACAALGERFRSGDGNGLLCVAQRPSSVIGDDAKNGTLGSPTRASMNR